MSVLAGGRGRPCVLFCNFLCSEGEASSFLQNADIFILDSTGNKTVLFSNLSVVHYDVKEVIHPPSRSLCRV